MQVNGAEAKHPAPVPTVLQVLATLSAFVTIVIVKVPVTEPPTVVSVFVPVKVYETALLPVDAVGVPLIVPVVVLSVYPVGSDGLTVKVRPDAVEFVVVILVTFTSANID